MSNQRRVLMNTPRLIMVFTLFGCSVGLVLPFLREYELDSQWRSLGTPPMMPKRLIAADFHTAYVETVGQQIYSCYRESRLDQRCWIPITVVPPIKPDGMHLTNRGMLHRLSRPSNRFMCVSATASIGANVPVLLDVMAR